MKVNIPPHPTPRHDQHIIISVTWTWTSLSYPTPPHDQRSIISFTWTWTLTSHPTPPHDQRSIIRVTWTWTLTSHPTRPPVIKQEQKNENKKKKNTKKTTKHPGALQRPWQLVTGWPHIVWRFPIHEGTPSSHPLMDGLSIIIEGLSIINHLFGGTPIYENSIFHK